MVDTADSDPDRPTADTFAALSDPIRIEIVEALAEYHQEHPTDPGVQFSTLRKSVGIRDSGRFLYHLEKLLGVFVEKTDDRYRLTYAGVEIKNAIVAGTYTNDGTIDSTGLDSTCSICGSSASASYDSGVLTVTCENEHPLFVWALPANAADGREIEELIELATTLAYHAHELVVGGTCSECYSPVEPTIRRVESSDPNGQPLRFTAHCEACGATWDVPVGFTLIGHPEVEALYRRQGRPIREEYWWELEFVGDGISIERLDEEPLTVRLSFEVGDRSLRATVEENGRIVQIRRRDSCTDANRTQ